MGNMKVVTNKFVIFLKLRKEVGQVNFLFRKRGVAVNTRLEREWVSHNLKRSKVECPLRRLHYYKIFYFIPLAV